MKKKQNKIFMNDKKFQKIIFGENLYLTEWFTRRILSDYMDNRTLKDLEDKELNKIGEFEISAIFDPVFKSDTRDKNFLIMSEKYTDMYYRYLEYSSRVGVLSADITCGLPNDTDNYDVGTFYLEDIEGNKYISNMIKFVYNVDSIMKYWYNKDRKNINKYAHIIMLLLNSNELKILERYIDRNDARIIDVYRKELEKFKYRTSKNKYAHR